MYPPLAGKVALVTGGGRGIGRAVVEGLAANGVSVAINALGESAGVTAATLEAAGHPALALAGDVSERGAVNAMIHAVVKKFGQLDILINNAGLRVRTSILDTSDDDWARVMGVNVDASFYATRAAALPMITAGRGGRIINISSALAGIGLANRAAYSASKAAVEALTRCSAIEFAPHGITVNAVAPGSTDTDDMAALPSSFRQALERRFALGRLARPEEIAAAVLFLASEGGSFITGEVIHVDGGWTRLEFDYRYLENRN